MTWQEFPRALRELRIERGLSQEALAEAAGLHRTFVSQLERGTRSPSLRTVDQLADALGVSLVEFATRMEVQS